MGKVFAQHARIGDKGALDRRPVVEVLKTKQWFDQHRDQAGKHQAVDQDSAPGEGHLPAGIVAGLASTTAASRASTRVLDCSSAVLSRSSSDSWGLTRRKI